MRFNGTAATTFSVSTVTTATATVPPGITTGNDLMFTPTYQGLRIKLQLVSLGRTFAFLGTTKVFMLSQLIASFATLPNPCCAGRTRHHLLSLLVIAVRAVVAGAETWVDIAHYGVLCPKGYCWRIRLSHYCRN